MQGTIDKVVQGTGARRTQVGQRRRVWASLGCAGGVGAAVALLLSSADAMFLSRVGTRHLGTAFAISAAVSMILLWWMGGLADRKDRARLLWQSSWVALSLVLCVIWINSSLPRLSAGVLLVFGKQIGGVLELLLWVVIADRFTAREARRVLPWIIVSNGAGAALGAALVGTLCEAFGTVGPLYVASGVLALVALAARLLMAAPDYRIGQQPSPSREEQTRRSNAAAAGIGVLRDRPLARWLALLVASAGVFAPMMYYLLGVTAVVQYPNEVELAGFFGSFRAYVQAASLVAQLAVAPWIVRRVGINTMLLLAPIGALLVSVSVGVSPTLIFVAAAQAITRVLDTAIQGPAEQLIQNLLPQHVRGRVAGLVGGVAKRSGVIVGGLSASLLVVWPSMFWGAIVAAGLLWLGVASLLSRRFSRLAVAELSRTGHNKSRWPGAIPVRFSDDRGLNKLRGWLMSEQGREQENAIALLRRVAEVGHVDILEELLEAVNKVGEGSRHRLHEAAWLELSQGVPPSIESQAKAWSLLHDSGASKLAIAVLSLSELRGEEVDRLEGGLALQSGALAQLARLRLRGTPLLECCEDVRDEELGYLLCAQVGWELREGLPNSADALAERLLRLLPKLTTVALQVRALESVVISLQSGSDSGLRVLIRSSLCSLSLRWRNAAQAALRRLGLIAWQAGGGSDLRPLVTALGDRDEEVRRCAEEGLRESGELALEALSVASLSPRRRVRISAVEILADLRPSSAALDALLESELAEIQRCAEHRKALASMDNVSLVLRRLGERIDEGVEAALMTLEARNRNVGFAQLARRLARAASARSRARVLEALDALLPRKVSHTILGALEGTVNTSLDKERAVMAELSGADHLTRDLLVLALGKEGRASYRRYIRSAASRAAQSLGPGALLDRLALEKDDTLRADVPSVLQTIVSLSELELFADLSTIQLEELALVVRWETAEQGDVLMEQGDDASCMYVVRTGHLTVWIDGSKCAEISAGEPVGELALFGEDRRTATVLAATACQLGSITREDIENLVEEVPGIALRLCRAMSRRLAETNRSKNNS